MTDPINPDLRNNTQALNQLAAALDRFTAPVAIEAGELMTANVGLRCCPCTDNAITNDTAIEDVPPAITMAPSIQTFTIGGQEVRAPVTIPVCLDCRKRQMGIVSKTGLIVT
jgi:hypothetical protein